MKVIHLNSTTSSETLVLEIPEEGVKELIEQLRRFRDERDWAQFHNPKDLAVSVSIEAAELLQIFQWRSEKTGADDALVEQIRDEAADVLLYLVLLCDAVGVDLMAAASDKIAKNRTRFPIPSSRGVAKPQDETLEK